MYGISKNQWDNSNYYSTYGTKCTWWHLTNWNAGLLLYNLIINGVDCSDCSILSYGYNISIIVKNKKRGTVELTYDNGDIKKLMQYFPSCINSEPFDGRIEEWNW